MTPDACEKGVSLPVLQVLFKKPPETDVVGHRRLRQWRAPSRYVSPELVSGERSGIQIQTSQVWATGGL